MGNLVIAPVDTGTWGFVASATLQHSNDTSKGFTGVTTYTKKKEIKLTEAVAGSVRIKFTFTGNGYSNEVYGRIYKNGVALGTEQIHGNNPNPEEASEDFSSISWQVNDLLQVYCKETAHPASPAVSNFRIYYDYDLLSVRGTTLTTAVVGSHTLSATNQDP